MLRQSVKFVWLLTWKWLRTGRGLSHAAAGKGAPEKGTFRFSRPRRALPMSTSAKSGMSPLPVRDQASAGHRREPGRERQAAERGELPPLARRELARAAVPPRRHEADS